MTSHINELRPDPTNRRKRTPRNIGMIVDALQKVGAARSIVIDETGEILAGNGVVEAAAEAGITKLQVVDADGSTIVAVRRSGLTPEQKRALAIYDNRTAELAMWDTEQLAADLKNGEDLSAFFYDEELAKILGVEGVKAGLTDPNEVPPERPTGIVAGDLFQLGRHRLLCGDSTSTDDVTRLLSPIRARFCFTSPPYVGQREYGSGGDLSVATLAQFFAASVEMVDLYAVNLGLARQDGAIFRYWDDYIASAELCGLNLLSWNVWHQGVQGSVGKLTAMFPIEHEFIFVFGRQRIDLNKTVPNKTAGDVRGTSDRQRDGSTKKKPVLEIAARRALGTVIVTPPEVSRAEATKDHPARFPVALVIPYLEACSNVGDVVYEPFSGSGTSLISCEQAGRICNAVEIEPRWAQMAIDRWEAFTGQKAQKVGEAIRA